MKRIFEIMKKCSRNGKSKEFVGHLTPTEICILMENGAQLKPFLKYVYEGAKEDKKKGISNGTWFYFIPPKGWGEK